MRLKMKNIKNIDKNINCCGCNLCSEICITDAIKYLTNNKGFITPIVNNKCVNCFLCVKHCPTIAHSMIEDSHSFFAAKRKNKRLRKKSQSGGAFSVFAESILKEKGVVYGVEETSDLNVKYCRITSNKDLRRLRGSKYTKAFLDRTYFSVLEDLKSNKKVLFSGSPCYVAGLKNFLSFKKADISNLICIDLVCHGVVSPKVYHDYLSFLEKRHKNKIKFFNFRDKYFGWDKHVITYMINRKLYRCDDYREIFYSNLALCDSCYSCNYSSLFRPGDITIGDCWGIKQIDRSFYDKSGCSLIITNTRLGEKLFSKTKDNFYLIGLDKNQCLQKNLCSPTDKPILTDLFWKDYDKYGFEYAAFKYCNINPSKEYEVLKKHEIFKRIARKISRIFKIRIK